MEAAAEAGESGDPILLDSGWSRRAGAEPAWRVFSAGAPSRYVWRGFCSLRRYVRACGMIREKLHLP
eukprot:5751537-Lingulodinium_polyedra.AAC.1